MATLTLSAQDLADLPTDALVLGLAAAKPKPRLLGAEALPAPARRALTDAVSVLGASGAADSVVRIPAVTGLKARSVVLAGVGDVKAVTPEALRRAAGAAVRELAGTAKVAVALPAADEAGLTAVAEGALLGCYSFDTYRVASAERSRPPVTAVTVVSPVAGESYARGVVKRARILAEAVHTTRDLINTAPVDLYPASFAERATAAVAGLPVAITVLDEKKLAKGGYGGLIGVGKGSARPPRLVTLEYAPKGAAVHLALVGKGITFDSGGLSIKPAAGMDAMKSDMSGAAAVLSTVVAIARLGLRIRVTGWLALAENMPSGTAQRPSDVLTVYGGKTVEVLNTDAEGRLVLADALVAAGETGPDVIIDVATLTGAQMVALGNRTSAIMSNHDGLRARVHTVADRVGEQFWPMPLPPELRSSMDSRVADIANIGERFGGMLVAGLFLQEFVPNRAEGGQVPWAHLDIAGPAFNTGSAFGYTPSGGTGVAVRTMLGLAEDLCSSPTV